MTKKDYQRIANLLDLGKIVGAAHGFEDEQARTYMIGAREQWLEIVNRMTAIVADDNPRFDRARFLKACGL